MGLISSLLSSGAGEVIEKAGAVIDNLTTSEEERLEAKNELQELFIEAEQAGQAEVTDRWKADMAGTWLSKNIRPITLVFLTCIFVIMSFFDGNLGSFTISDAYKPIYQTLLLTVYGAYFAGRSIEKVKGAAK